MKTFKSTCIESNDADNEANRAMVNTIASAALAVTGLVDLQTAAKIVHMIANGTIPHVSITY